MTLSFDQIRELVITAVRTAEGPKFSCYASELYSDAIVYSSYGETSRVEKIYKRSYSIVDGVVTLGDAVEVKREVQYVPIQAACQIVAAVEGDDTGTKWRICAVKFGEDKNGIYWDQATLKASVDLFNGAKVFALNDSQHKDPKKASKFGKSTRELVGALTAAAVESDGIYANLVVMPSAAWLSNDLTACTANNIDFVYGLSVDISCTAVQKVVAGKKLTAPGVIRAVQVDVVYDPAAGGGFIERLAAAVEAGHEEESHMFDKLLAALQSKRPDLHAQITAGIAAGTMTQDAALEQIAAATIAHAGGDTGNKTLVAAAVTEFKQLLAATPATESQELQKMQLLACGITLSAALTASKLPDVVQTKLQSQFKGQVFTEEALQAAIKLEKETLDSLTASGTVHGAGDVRINLGRESSDKLQAAFDKMLNVTVAGDLQSVPGFTSLRAAYGEMTGDTDVNGILNPQQLRRMQAAYGDTTFAHALGNSMYRRLTQDYRETSDLGVSRLVGNNIRNAVDFRPMESIRIGYYGALPEVDTDTDDYPDLGEIGDEQLEYALVETGGIITINRRMIVNNDLRLVEKIISRLPRGARRGEARRVWAPLLTNATYKGDGKAIFHADHGNLGSSAYSIAAALAAVTAMFNQTEPGSNEKIGLTPVTVSYPSELHGLVKNVNDFNPQAVAVENGNSMYQYFLPEGLHRNPLMTDANDWIMAGDPNECEIIEVAYLNGQREPQMLVADNPANGQMFVGGRIQYRISHDLAAEVIDYRNLYKSVVA